MDLPEIIDAVIPRSTAEVIQEVSVVIAGALTSNERISTMTRFKARPEKIGKFIEFLIAHHASYKNVQIDQSRLQVTKKQVDY